MSFPSITKNGRERLIPYGDLVQASFYRLPKLGDRLFSSRNINGTIFSGWAKSKKKFDKVLVGVEPYTLHDLRRTFSSNTEMIGTPIIVAEKLLDHISETVIGVAAIYNRHSYMDEMREAIVNCEVYLSNLVTG